MPSEFADLPASLRGARFFAPDTEPSLPANLRVTGIEGLSDYSRPRRADIRVKAPKVRPLSFNGSGPGINMQATIFAMPTFPALR